MSRFFRAILAGIVLTALSGSGQSVFAQVTTIEDTNTGITYSGTWSTVSYASASGGTMRRSSNGASAVGSFFQYTFTGTQIEFYGAKSNNSGAFDVYLDGVKVASIANQFSSQDQWQVLLWSSGAIANTSHTVKFVVTSNPDWAFLDFFRVTTGSGGGNTPPTVSITSPANGAVYNAPASIVVNASATDTAPGTVSSVQFLSGTTSLGTDNTNPYSVTWANVAAGTYSLTAKATDNGTAVTTSAIVRVIVNGTTGGGGGTCSSASGEPTDNPVATKYGSTAYPWTANIKWNCVFNINNYAGANTVAKFNAARDAAAANGGGVVYFPAGNYSFTDHIYLKNGVVMRGATPSASDAKSATYAPQSKLTFPEYIESLSGSGTPNSTAFKYISTTSTNTDSNIGVVNLDINRAAIKIVAGEAATQNNRHIVIFGIRQNNVAEPDPGVPASFQNAWQRWSYRFACNVKVMGLANIIVANNRINDAVTDNYDQPGYIVKNGTSANVTYTNGSQATFNYTDHYGIDVNRSKAGGYSLGGTSATEPTLFRTGNVIRDNYVYHTMRIAISGSGDGLVIKDNQIRDKSGKVAWVGPTGQNQVGNANTLENRAIDFSGANIYITGNDYAVYRHNLRSSGYLSVDGEGILIQECCGGAILNGATITNNYGPAANYIGLYKIRTINNVTIASNTVNVGCDGSGCVGGIFVQADTNATPYAANNVKIQSNSVNAAITLTANSGSGTGNQITGNTATTATSIKYSCEANVSISGNSNFTVAACH